MRVPVLTYHAANVTGHDYHDNDHVALAADLAMIDDLGLQIVPAHWLVEQHLGLVERDLTDCVALTCDDGTDLDFYDIRYPEFGRQRSFFNCLRDLHAARGRECQPQLHLTSFVIASAEARDSMDRRCLYGRGWMHASWWRAAAASGLMAIENHSFDHNHGRLPEPGPGGMTRGSFMQVDNAERAAAEISAAQRIIADRIAPRRPSLFCYPFGHVPDFLCRQWLPENSPALGLKAAFGDGAEPATEDHDIWNLPRYICGWHWKSPEELQQILLRN